MKILDFGLAKLTQAEPTGAAMSALPTAPPRTTPGLVLGTIGYMSPEQVRGLAADHRSDIFAFGAILYEMLGAQRAFRGDTMADTMTAILKEDPPDLPAAERHIPPALTRIVDRCLEKNPAARFQTASDLGFALEGCSSHSDSAAAMAIPAGAVGVRSSAHVAWSAAAGSLALAVAATAAAGWLWLGRTTAEPAKVSFDVQTESAPSPLQLALSPDGSRLLAIVNTPQGSALWLRRLDQVTGQTLAGNTGVTFPFWSPDGRSIAFFASGTAVKSFTPTPARFGL